MDEKAKQKIEKENRKKVACVKGLERKWASGEGESHNCPIQ